MKKHRWFKQSLSVSALACTLAAAAAVWPSSQAKAIGNPDIRPAEFGLLGLAAGQTARLTVVNPSPRATSEAGTRVRSVQLAFEIYAIGDVEHQPGPVTPDDSTTRLTTLRVVARHARLVALRPGEAASFAFTASGPDTYFSATALSGPDTSTAIGNPDIVPTLEVMEGSRTLYTHPALIRGFNPQPDPPGIR